MAVEAKAVTRAIALENPHRVGAVDRAHRVYGHEQRGAGHQVLVVDVAGMNARRAGADTPHSWCGSDPHHAEKRTVDWYHDSGGDLCGLGLAIDRDDAPEHTREFVRQRARV